MGLAFLEIKFVDFRGYILLLVHVISVDICNRFHSSYNTDDHYYYYGIYIWKDYHDCSVEGYHDDDGGDVDSDDNDDDDGGGGDDDSDDNNDGDDGGDDDINDILLFCMTGMPFCKNEILTKNVSITARFKFHRKSDISLSSRSETILARMHIIICIFLPGEQGYSVDLMI